MTPDIRNRLAARVAQDIPEGAYVNLGVGLPTLVANYIPASLEVFLHSENGVLGRWMKPRAGHEDPDMINAGKEPIELLPGAAIFDHTISFGMMRGGHLDICVLGAYQVAANGDLANWHTGEPGAVPAVGGAMDLAAGAKKVFVVMEHLGKGGVKKILSRCTYPLTGLRCVSRIYTDLAIMDVRPEGVWVIELSAKVTREAVQDATGAPLEFDPGIG
jgi:3-oxoadipate CoA-transferase, beta subunit